MALKEDEIVLAVLPALIQSAFRSDSLPDTQRLVRLAYDIADATIAVGADRQKRKEALTAALEAGKQAAQRPYYSKPFGLK